jgi:hypothetical protein
LKDYKFVVIEGVNRGNESKEFLYQCLVRDVIKKRIADRDKAFEFLGRWEIHHPNSKLREDVLYQWQRGNRGKEGEWYDREDKQTVA